MKCVQCGKELSPTAKFCTNCGTPVVQHEEGINYEFPNENEYEICSDKFDVTPDTNIEKQGNATSLITNLRKNWNDRFTILVIIGAMFIAVIAGLFVKSAKQQEDFVDVDNYAYKEYDNSEAVYEETKDYYEEDSLEEHMDEGSLEESQFEEVSQDFVLPESSSRFLTKSDLNGLSAEECRIARNEIYARHGRMFKDEALQTYFESFDWYYPTIHPDNFEESMLNEYEIANRDLIVEYETEQGYR